MNEYISLLILQMMFVYGAFVWTIPWYIVFMPTIILLAFGISIFILATIATMKKTKEIKKEGP